jgi:hypothetical protein
MPGPDAVDQQLAGVELPVGAHEITARMRLSVL